VLAARPQQYRPGYHGHTDGDQQTDDDLGGQRIERGRA
jgi:hypothetical protein